MTDNRKQISVAISGQQREVSVSNPLLPVRLKGGWDNCICFKSTRTANQLNAFADYFLSFAQPGIYVLNVSRAAASTSSSSSGVINANYAPEVNLLQGGEMVDLQSYHGSNASGMKCYRLNVTETPGVVKIGGQKINEMYQRLFITVTFPADYGSEAVTGSTTNPTVI